MESLQHSDEQLLDGLEGEPTYRFRNVPDLQRTVQDIKVARKRDPSQNEYLIIISVLEVGCSETLTHLVNGTHLWLQEPESHVHQVVIPTISRAEKRVMSKNGRLLDEDMARPARIIHGGP